MVCVYTRVLRNYHLMLHETARWKSDPEREII